MPKSRDPPTKMHFHVQANWKSFTGSGQMHQSYLLHRRLFRFFDIRGFMRYSLISIVSHVRTPIGSTAGSMMDSLDRFVGGPINGPVDNFLSCSTLGGCRRSAMFIASPRPHVSLHRGEAGTCSWRVDIINPRNTALAAVLCPRLLFAA
jgi:hypothetical protein